MEHLDLIVVDADGTGPNGDGGERAQDGDAGRSWTSSMPTARRPCRRMHRAAGWGRPERRRVELIERASGDREGATGAERAEGHADGGTPTPTTRNVLIRPTERMRTMPDRMPSRSACIPMVNT